jgi:hypothetical protein
VEAPAINALSCREQNIFPLAINIFPANRHDGKGIVPLLHQFAGGGFKGTALDDLSSCDQRLPRAGEAPGIAIKSSAGDRGGTFLRRVFVGTERFLAVTDPFRHFAWST